MLVIQAFLSSGNVPFFPPEAFATLGPALLTWAWILALAYSLWLIRPVYTYIVERYFDKSIRMVYWEVVLPDTAAETPKAMEVALSVWSGVHKNPDVYEKYFEGYAEAKYALEMRCTPGKAQYIVAVDIQHKQFFEGVIYGQYPSAKMREVPDYTLSYTFDNLEKTYSAYGTDMILAKPSYYPIRTYRLYGDQLAPEEKFIDPHQALVEAFTRIQKGEEYWFQVVIRPTSSKSVEKWMAQAEKEIEEIREGGGREEGSRFFDPVETAKMEAIVDKLGREPYITTVRIYHVAPVNQLREENIQRGTGAFSQFDTLHLNSFTRNPRSRTDAPVFIWREMRRKYRERRLLYYYRSRTHKDGSDIMMNSEEIATLYHFPTKWIKTPSLERPHMAQDKPPPNLPFV